MAVVPKDILRYWASALGLVWQQLVYAKEGYLLGARVLGNLGAATEVTDFQFLVLMVGEELVLRWLPLESFLPLQGELVH